jgi:hypothetical protein
MATVKEIKEKLRAYGVAPGKRRKSELLDLLHAEEGKVKAKEDLRFKGREASNKAIRDFMNDDPDSFSMDDAKNGQGLITAYVLHKLMEQSPERGGFEPRDIADYIRENKLWFKPSIVLKDGIFSVGKGSLAPYMCEMNGVTQPTMYARDKNSRISSLILDKLRGNVLSPKRQHTLIMRSVDQSAVNEYYLRPRSPSKFAMHLQSFKMEGEIVSRGEWTSPQWKGTHFKITS